MPKLDGNFILVSSTDLVRCGISKERVRAALENVAADKTDRRLKLYRLEKVFPLFLKQPKPDKERLEAAKADLAEIKVQIAKRDVVSWKAALIVWGDKLKRLSDTVKGLEGLTEKQKQRICFQIKQDLDRLPFELDDCAITDHGEANEENEDEAEE